MTSASERTSTPDRKQLLSLLKSLAQKGVHLKREGGKEKALLWTLVRQDRSERPVDNPDLVAVLERQGHLESGRHQTLILSSAGRLALKRWLSAGDGYFEQHREIRLLNVADPQGGGRTAVPVNLCESPLAWLASRKDRNGRSLLDRAQVEAGERLRADYGFARLMPTMSGGWRTGGGGGTTGNRGRAADLSDDVIAARQRVERVLTGLEPVLAGLLVDVCCHLKGLTAVEVERGWPARSGKVVLQIALTGLASRYGYVTTAGNGDGRIRAEQPNRKELS
ncbi:DUF6456 domain-containing protein [Labrenzia sp. CE80]|uniref:DUF6456 domain-containing protein n=1 Tax=Labrenzia sp. CE80 TaxID=1788986 RepID=UPI00129A8C08|nr:DUF6456 domain-containing protein [Labrenzia sp. CE80]